MSFKVCFPYKVLLQPREIPSVVFLLQTAALSYYKASLVESSWLLNYRKISSSFFPWHFFVSGHIIPHN